MLRWVIFTAHYTVNILFFLYLILSIENIDYIGILGYFYSKLHYEKFIIFTPYTLMSAKNFRPCSLSYFILSTPIFSNENIFYWHTGLFLQHVIL